MSGAMTTGMMSSATDDWGTPSDFYATLAHEFPFTLDVAAAANNAKCERWYGIEEDGLAQPWAPDVCWMNPPYGRAIGAWVAKAYQESRLGATVVGLLPARTDTAWWHDYVAKASEVRFVRGRLKFYNRAPGPFPLCRGRLATFCRVMVAKMVAQTLRNSPIERGLGSLVPHTGFGTDRACPGDSCVDRWPEMRFGEPLWQKIVAKMVAKALLWLPVDPRHPRSR